LRTHKFPRTLQTLLLIKMLRFPIFHCTTNTEGSIKGDVKRKHDPSLLRGGFFLTSSPSATQGFVERQSGQSMFGASFAPASSGLAVANHGSI
jgi:hypothetical protein